MNVVAPVRDYIDSLVHASARIDPLRAARHRSFIAVRLLGGLAGLAILPLYLVQRGALTSFEIFVFAWFVAPVAIAYYVAGSGRYHVGQLLSSLALATLVTAAGIASGEFTVAVAVWLILVPLESAFGSSRPVVLASTIFAGIAALVIFQATYAVSPDHTAGHQWLDAGAVVVAIVYATILALNAELFARTSSRLLSQEGERYRLLAANMTDLITRHGRGGTVLFASAAAQQTFGAPAEDLLGYGIFDRIHVSDRPIYLTALASAANGEGDAAAEFRIRRNVTPQEATVSGQFAWIEMRCRSLPHSARENADAGEVVAVMRDVTERRHQQETIATARRDAEAANQAKSRFLAMMSHELRTPLNAVIGFSEMLIEEKSLQLQAERRREYAELIRDSGQHLLSVVNLILDVSKIESGTLVVTPERCAPAPIIRSCCDLLALKAHEGNIALALQADPNGEDVMVDQRALKQMLINLISNAIKFTPSGGRVSVRATIERDMFVIAVEDTGIGIAEADLPRIGSPFYQAQPSYNRRYEGTGLGLSIVKGLAELHGGRLDITSRVGAGTCVKVLLPKDGPTETADGHAASERAEVILLEPQVWSDSQARPDAHVHSDSRLHSEAQIRSDAQVHSDTKVKQSA